MASVSISNVVIIDPRNRHAAYTAILPSAHTAAGGVTAAEGVVLTLPYSGVNLGLAFNVSSADNTVLLNVYGAMDGPSVTPTDMNWSLIRGDTSTGANVLLSGVSCNQQITVQSPAVIYKIAALVTGAAGAGVTGHVITYRAMLFDKSLNW